MKPKISIVVPVYNTEKYISRCIESILAQTFQNFEIILVDDGSSDNSLEICRRYRADDSRIKVYTQKNSGQSAARNLGISYAQADYIGFVDSDDYIHPTMYERMYDSALSSDADIIKCGFVNIKDKNLYDYCSELFEYGDDEVLYSFVPSKPAFDEKEFLSLLCTQTGWGSLCNGIYKKYLHEKFPLNIGKKMEDYAFNIDCCKLPLKVFTIDDIPYFYVYREGSTVNSGNIRLRLYSSEMFMVAFKIALSHKNEKLAIYNYSQSTSYYFEYYEKNGCKADIEKSFIADMKEYRKYSNNVFLSFRILMYLINPKLYNVTAIPLDKLIKRAKKIKGIN